LWSSTVLIGVSTENGLRTTRLSFRQDYLVSTGMVIREIRAKTTLSRSKVFDYVINPYIGCQHGCTYCYARFMKRFTGHSEPWGQFVDIKSNASELLQREIAKLSPGRVWISGVCDPYQPLEKIYLQTRKCLEILLNHNWPVTIQTKSPLVVRDMDLMKGRDELEVGLSVTTADDGMRRLFEPHAPPIAERIQAVEQLHLAGIRTFAMIAPMLPGVERLATVLTGKVDYVLIDRMNYHYSDWIYKKYQLEGARSDEFFLTGAFELVSAFEKMGIECQMVF
jgi:DNA repair photolyase